MSAGRYGPDARRLRLGFGKGYGSGDLGVKPAVVIRDSPQPGVLMQRGSANGAPDVELRA